MHNIWRLHRRYLQYGVHQHCCNMSLCEAARSLMRQKQVQLMDVDVAVIITVVVILTVSQVNIMWARVIPLTYIRTSHFNQIY